MTFYDFRDFRNSASVLRFFLLGRSRSLSQMRTHFETSCARSHTTYPTTLHVHYPTLATRYTSHNIHKIHHTQPAQDTPHTILLCTSQATQPTLHTILHVGSWPVGTCRTGEESTRSTHNFPDTSFAKRSYLSSSFERIKHEALHYFPVGRIGDIDRQGIRTRIFELRLQRRRRGRLQRFQSPLAHARLRWLPKNVTTRHTSRGDFPSRPKVSCNWSCCDKHNMYIHVADTLYWRRKLVRKFKSLRNVPASRYWKKMSNWSGSQ